MKVQQMMLSLKLALRRIVAITIPRCHIASPQLSHVDHHHT